MADSLTLPLINEQETYELFKENLKLTDQLIKKIGAYADLIQESNRNFFSKQFRLLIEGVKEGTLEGIRDLSLEEKNPSLLEDIRDTIEEGNRKYDELLQTEVEKNRKDEEERLENNRKYGDEGGYFKALFKQNESLGKLSGGLSGKLVSFYAMLLNPKLFLGALGVTRLAPLVLAALSTPVAAIIAGLGTALSDAIASINLKETFNVDSVSAAIAGFLAGDGTNTLFSNIKQYGKWIAMGAGIGLPFGPIGVIAGAIIGGAIGALAKYLGPELIADKVQGVIDGAKKLADIVIGTDYYLNTDKLKESIENTKQVLKNQTEELVSTNTEIASIEAQLVEARRSGNDSEVAALQERLSDLQTHRDIVSADLERENDKLKQYNSDLELAGKTFTEKLGIIFNRNLEDLKNFAFEGIFETLPGKLAMELYNFMEETYGKIYATAEEFGRNAAIYVIGKIENSIDKTKEIFESTYNQITDSVENLKTVIMDKVDETIQSTIDAFRNTAKSITDWMKEFFNFNNIKRLLFGDKLESLYQSFEDKKQAFVDSINKSKEYLSDPITAAKEMINPKTEILTKTAKEKEIIERENSVAAAMRQLNSVMQNTQINNTAINNQVYNGIIRPADQIFFGD